MTRIAGGGGRTVQGDLGAERGGRAGTAIDREEQLRGVVETIGLLARDQAASGRQPLGGRRVGRGRMDLLRLLSRPERWSVRRLAEATGVTSGAVSQTVEALRAEGLVTSSIDPADSRRRTIRLTDTARQEVDAFEERWFHAQAARYDALSTVEVAVLNELLLRVRPATDR